MTKKIKTTWDLSLLYKNDTDPTIEADIQDIETQCDAFLADFGGKKDLYRSSPFLKEALLRYEKLLRVLSGAKPLLYFHYRSALSAFDTKAEAAIARLTTRVSKANNKILFFELGLGALPKKEKDALCTDTTLKRYHYFFSHLFAQSKHFLSEGEEKIMNLKDLPAHELWTASVDHLLNEKEIVFEGKKIPLAQAQGMYSSLPTAKRRAIGRRITAVYKAVAPHAENELNAIVTNKKINDELRHFEEAFSGTVLQYQNDEKVVAGLVREVSESFPISHRFYDLKRRLLRLPYLQYIDRSASIGVMEKKYTFEQTVTLIKKAFGKVSPAYAAIIDSFLERGQIDVLPKTGKSGGAFCSSSLSAPTFVLLNHTNDIRSVLTFAHEMGHAIHAEFGATVNPLYHSPSMVVAETASTLFERFIDDVIIDTLSKKEKVVYLHNRINDIVSIIFRQIACFNFEVALHRGIRENGRLTKEEIVKIMNTHMKAYLGPAVRLTDDDGYMFASWHHIRRFFYVYSYAYGGLVSAQMHALYTKDQNYVKRIDAFLSSGATASPEALYAAAGIDTTAPGFFASATEEIQRDIDRLERAAQEAGML